MKLRFFFAEGVGKIGCVVSKERDGLIILNVCPGRPSRRNSVLEGLRVR